MQMQKYALGLVVLLLVSCQSTMDFDFGEHGTVVPEPPGCSSDTDGDAICDMFDMCLLDGPEAEFRDLASNQVLTITNVKLDGSTNTLVGVEAGSNFRVQYDWYYNSFSSCCECTTYVSVGYTDSPGPDHCQPAFTGCLAEGRYETTLPAPPEPGTYYIGFRMHREGICPTAWQDPPMAQAFAAICVI